MSNEALIVKLFGSKLMGSNGEDIETATALTSKKAVILYFSASWCGPCRRFTPVLSKAVKEYKESGGEEIEVLFVSRDKTESSFSEYHQKMSFPAVTFEEANRLAREFGVQGIPELVMVSPEGNVIHGSVDLRGLIQKQGADALSLTKIREEEDFKSFFDACMGGDVVKVKARLDASPGLANLECPKDWHYQYIRRGGWQPVGGGNPGVKNASGDVYLISNFPAFGLHLAAGNGHTEIVKLLMESGASLEAQDGDGDTALTWATYCGRRETMEQLMAAGADAGFAKHITRLQFEGIKGDGDSLDWLKKKCKTNRGLLNATDLVPLFFLLLVSCVTFSVRIMST